jgi:hypothetical protein
MPSWDEGRKTEDRLVRCLSTNPLMIIRTYVVEGLGRLRLPEISLFRLPVAAQPPQGAGNKGILEGLRPSKPHAERATA